MKKYKPPQKKGNDWLIAGSVILSMIVILLLVAVLDLTTPPSQNTPEQTTPRPTPTPTPTRALPTPTPVSNAQFCKDIRQAFAPAQAVTERLSSHALQGSNNPSLLSDPDWRDEARTISLDLARIATVFRVVYYSPDAEHLRPKVSELASHFEILATVYEQAIDEYDLESLELVWDILIDMLGVLEEISFVAICG